jgi:hypothetical protein
MTIRDIEIEYAPEEPYSLLPRSIFDLFHPATVGVVLPGAILRSGIACDQTHLQFTFQTDNTSGMRQTLYLPMMLPRPGTIVEPPIHRILLGTHILERRRAEVSLNYSEIFQKTQQYPPTPCGTLMLNP